MNPMYSSQYSSYGPTRRVNFGWIGESWRWFTQNPALWVGGIVMYSILNALLSQLMKGLFANPDYFPPTTPFPWHSTIGVNYGTNSQLTPLGQVLNLVLTFSFGAFQSACLYHMALKQVRGEPIRSADLFSGRPYWLNMLLFNIISSIGFVLGIIALCFGIFVVAGFLLPGQAMVADGKDAGEAFSECIAAMKNDWLNAAAFAFVFSLLIAASCIPCLLGLLVTVPMLNIIGVLAYRDMAGMPGLAAPAPPVYQAPQPGVWPPPPTPEQPLPSQPWPPPSEPPLPPQTSADSPGNGV